MSNSAQVTAGSGKDINAAMLVVDFESGSGSRSAPGVRYASQVTLTTGEQPSYALIGVPCRLFPKDELALNIAMALDGPAGTTKLLARGKVSFQSGRNSLPLIAGSLIQYKHDISEDSVVAMLVDDRYWLGKVTVTGRACYDPQTKKHYYDGGAPLEFNRLGWPDCIDTPEGPRFAPGHRYGYKADYTFEDYTEPEVGKATVRARSWTCQDAMNYLRDMYYVREGDKRPDNMPYDYLSNVLPSKLIMWPATVSQVAGTQRSIKACKVENMSLLRALTKVLRRAGAYDLYMDASGYLGIISVVNMNARQSAGETFYLPSNSSDIGQLMNDSTSVKGGYVTESCANYFHRTVICGDPPAIERMLSTTATGTGALALENAWSAADEAAFKAYVTDHGKNRIAFDCAARLWPMVYCAYRVKKAYQLWAGTKWSTHKPKNYPHWRPTLLTGKQMNSTNPADFVASEVSIEFMPSPGNNPALNTSWVACARYDGLTLGEDGEILMLPALRDQASPCTWRPTGGGGQYSGAFQALPIRLTAPIEGDFRATAMNETDPNYTAGRIDPSAPQMPWLAVADAGDYVDWLRKDSHPNGTGVSTSPINFDNFPDKCTAGSELFTDCAPLGTAGKDRMAQHAQKRQEDVRRIEYGGTIIMSTFGPSHRPGGVRDIAGDSCIPNRSVIKSCTLLSGLQEVHIELANFDAEVIYDLPVAQPQTSHQDLKAKGGETPPNYQEQQASSYPGSPGEQEMRSGRQKEADPGEFKFSYTGGTQSPGAESPQVPSRADREKTNDYAHGPPWVGSEPITEPEPQRRLPAGSLSMDPSDEAKFQSEHKAWQGRQKQNEDADRMKAAANAVAISKANRASESEE